MNVEMSRFTQVLNLTFQVDKHDVYLTQADTTRQSVKLSKSQSHVIFNTPELCPSLSKRGRNTSVSPPAVPESAPEPETESVRVGDWEQRVQCLVRQHPRLHRQFSFRSPTVGSDEIFSIEVKYYQDNEGATEEIPKYLVRLTLQYSSYHEPQPPTTTNFDSAFKSVPDAKLFTWRLSSIAKFIR